MLRDIEDATLTELIERFMHLIPLAGGADCATTNRIATMTDALYAVRMLQAIMKKLNALMPADRYDSKDWKAGGPIERVDWLLTMYESAKAQLDFTHKEKNDA